MTKKIYPYELAEIVAGLLINPELFGELETEEKFMSFMDDIGSIVARHCGGNIVGISKPEADGDLLSSKYHMPMLSVEPCTDLPDISSSVWSHYDPYGWEDIDEELYGELIIPEKKQTVAFRRSVQLLLTVNNPICWELKFYIRDYHTDIDDAQVMKIFETKRAALVAMALYLTARMDFTECPLLPTQLAHADQTEKAKYVGGLTEQELENLIDHQMAVINEDDHLEGNYQIALVQGEI
ncbi:hypothetical protein OCT63_17115 [Vibrio sp. RW]|uniref:hypothetical protein n=1 Tax=Vibrio sp. RW TaxID=2998833 RepID=UPI0022CD3A37|nr:hypothetical protein [Vibrio sp. RW]MDA0145948.1 hypothetical protein [Vibrio sp. RW]